MNKLEAAGLEQCRSSGTGLPDGAQRITSGEQLADKGEQGDA